MKFYLIKNKYKMSKYDKYQDIVLDENDVKVELDSLKKPDERKEEKEEQTMLIERKEKDNCLFNLIPLFGVCLVIFIGFMTWILVCGTLRGNNSNYTTNLCI
jgi:hypothetical protein